MKSTFRRYCLTHTYLSPYVKTSNEDKYKRTSGIAYLIGVLMLICALPARADDFVLDIREGITGELPEWSKDFEEAEINNRALRDYLEEKIIPYFENVEGKGEDRLFVTFTGEKDANGEKVRIIAMDKCLTCSGVEQSLNNPDENNKTYATVISGVVVFLINENTNRAVSQLITPTGKRYIPNPEYWIPKIVIHDEAGFWQLHVTDDNIKLDWFQGGESDVFSKWKE